MNLESLISLPASMKGLSAAGGTLLAEAAAHHVDGVPAWITALGLPTAFCVCVIYALIASNNERKASEAGRLTDKDEYVEAIRADMASGAESRDKLITLAAQTNVSLDRLTEEIRRSLLQK